ncbi:hypothetical protein B0H13DRAFT_2020225 [Mycena leptocephala]|nr:hypothetical protein B0H13DRAFT_2020225 [Mycena leptocephala]
MSASPTSLGVGTPFASSASSSPMPTPARMWSDFSSVPASTATSSPAPEDDGEMKVSPFFGKGFVACTKDAQNVDANTNLAEDRGEETLFLRVPTVCCYFIGPVPFDAFFYNLNRRQYGEVSGSRISSEGNDNAVRMDIQVHRPALVTVDHPNTNFPRMVEVSTVRHCCRIYRAVHVHGPTPPKPLDPAFRSMSHDIRGVNVV